MAQTIPDKCPSKIKGEQRLFGILKRLPDDVVVYYEPVIDNRHPDFVVILPTLGVLLIEVKGWYCSNILEGNPQSVRVRDGDHEVVHKHPLRQVEEYKFLLMDNCKKDKQYSDLANFSGPHTGKFRFPFVNIAILSNITREELTNVPQGSKVFPPTDVMTRDQLIAWEQLDTPALMGVLKGFFAPFFKIDPMTKNQVNIVKAVLHPEILLGLEFDNPNRLEEPTVKVLDLKQEAAARDLGEGHRLVFGVAGSGKTVLLVARAKLIARLNPNARVLVLCYNVSFAASLKKTLEDCKTITVRNFHLWAWDNGVQGAKDDSELGETLLTALKNGAPDAQKFDHVLIDEAQDFDSTWYACVRQAMKDPTNGELLIVGDGSQGLYKRKKVSWKELGIQAQGRTQYLEANYRNTQQIISLAKRFASGVITSDEDGLAAPLVDPGKCIRLAGSSAVLLTKKSPREEVDRVVRVVKDLLNGKWFDESVPHLSPDQIGLLYRRDHPLLYELREKLTTGANPCPAIWLNEKGANAKRRIGEPGVKILTMHGSKGLQFKAVILLFADDCPAQFPDSNEEEERRLFYVALTRAEDYLVISRSRESKFTNEIELVGKEN